MRRVPNLFRFAALALAGALPHCTLTNEDYRARPVTEGAADEGTGALGAGADSSAGQPNEPSQAGKGGAGGSGASAEPSPDVRDAAADVGAVALCSADDAAICDAAAPVDAGCSGAECPEAGCIGDACAPPDPPEPPEPSCTDGVQNGDETGSDCGGPCAPCAAGEGCENDADCESEACQDERCCGGQLADCTRCARRLSEFVNCDSNGPEPSPTCTAFLDCLAANPEACPVRTRPGCADEGGVCDHTLFGGNGSPGVALADSIIGNAECNF